MNAIAAANTARPNGVQLKKSSGAKPRPRNVLSMIILGEIDQGHHPADEAATDNGMSMRLLFRLVFLANGQNEGDEHGDDRR